MPSLIIRVYFCKVRNFVCKSSLSILLLFAVLTSVFRFSLTYASNTIESSAQFSYSSKKITKHTSDFRDLIFEDLELDDESDDEDEIDSFTNRKYFSLKYNGSRCIDCINVSLYCSNHLLIKEVLPLFIEFQNFRI